MILVGLHEELVQRIAQVFAFNHSNPLLRMPGSTTRDRSRVHRSRSRVERCPRLFPGEGSDGFLSSGGLGYITPGTHAVLRNHPLSYWI
jgi:hypothetical protein